MSEPANAAIVRNLAAALNQLQDDVARVELLTAALDVFQQPVPEYRPGDQHLLRHANPSRRR